MTRNPRFTRDERAVSVTVTHALTLAITAILVTGLLTGAATMLDRQQQTAVRMQLEDIGGDVVGQLNAVDRLNDAGAADASLRVTFPNRVSGTPYRVELDRTGTTATGYRGVLRLESDDPNVRVTVPVHTETRLRDTTVTGNQLAVQLCDGPTPELTLGRGC